MRRLEVPGGSFGDARVVDQAYAVQRSGQKVVWTHATDLSAPDDFLFVRIPYVGSFKIAAKQHNGNDAMEWDGSTWQDRGFAGGNRPVIYDATGNLVIAQAGPNTPTGSIGYRYVDDAGRLVPSVETYADPARNIDEYTTKGDVTIGQSGIGGCVALVDGKRYLLEPGDTEFINVDRQGDSFAITIVKPMEHKTVILWCDRSEFAQFPEQVLSPDPVPAPPAPAPSPVPEPIPMTVPDFSSDVHAACTARPDLVAANSLASVAELVHVACEAMHAKDPGFVYLSKVPDETQYEGRSQDSVIYVPANATVKLFSGAGDPHPAAPVWIVGGAPRDTDHPIYPDPATFGASPTPPPDQPPLPSPDPRFAALQAEIDAIKAQLAALPPPGPPVDLSAYAKHGDAVTVTGHMTLNFFGASIRTQDATLTGTITK